MNKIERIDFFMPLKSRYGVLDGFTKEIYTAFKSKGFSCRLLSGKDILDFSLNDPADVTFCFNGAPRLDKDTFLADAIKKPHICWLVDLPYYYWSIIESPYIYIACDDEVSCQLLKKQGHTRHCFLPQAAEPLLSEPLSFSEREIAISCLASYFDFEKERKEWWSLPYRFVNILEEASQRALVEEDRSFVDLFFECYNKLIFDENIPLLPQSGIFGLLKRLEYYLKGKARAQMLCAAPEGLIQIYDQDWQKYLEKKRPDIQIHAAVSYKEAKDIMAKSKIVMSNSIRSPFGGSERVLNAMMAGAIAATNANPYMNKEFENEKNIFLYKQKDLKNSSNKLQELVADEILWKKISLAGQEQALLKHTWSSRVESLLALLG